MFFLVWIGGRAGRGVPNFPELLDELLSGLVGGQLQKGCLFLPVDDVGGIPVKPFPVVRGKLILGAGKGQRAEWSTYGGNPEEENDARTEWMIVKRTHRL